MCGKYSDFEMLHRCFIQLLLTKTEKIKPKATKLKILSGLFTESEAKPAPFKILHL